jgi:hypothetical protein
VTLPYLKHVFTVNTIFVNIEGHLDRKCLQTKYPEFLYTIVPTTGKIKEKINLKIKTVLS